MSRIGKTGRAVAVAAALAITLATSLAPAFAQRAGGGGGMGSRGSFSNSAPRATPTAPNSQPLQRTQSQQAQPQQNFNRPQTPMQQPGGMFSSPLARGIMGGLIGAGIFGLLSGSGLFNGLGSLAGMFGLLLQIGLIAIVAMVALSWWRRRQQPAMASIGGMNGLQGGASGYRRDGMGQNTGQTQGGQAGASGFGSMFGSGSAQPATRPLEVTGDDYPAFERLLSDIQTAYAAEDLATLRRIATPEMVGYFDDDIAAMKRKGHATRASDVKMLEGDLSEAWSEPDFEYATVAMKFSLIDAIVDRVTGKLVDGDLQKPNIVTEIWTFVRPTGGKAQDWKLSAIQQAN